MPLKCWTVIFRSLFSLQYSRFHCFWKKNLPSRATDIALCLQSRAKTCLFDLLTNFWKCQKTACSIIDSVQHLVSSGLSDHKYLIYQNRMFQQAFSKWQRFHQQATEVENTREVVFKYATIGFSVKRVAFSAFLSFKKCSWRLSAMTARWLLRQ